MRLPNPTFYATALLVLLLDQSSKVAIRAALEPGQSIPDEGLLRLTYVTNTGAAFGILPDQTLILTLVAVVVSAVILVYGNSMAYRGWLLGVTLGLQLGGAVGNLIDRVLFGHVTDFLDLRNFDGQNIWPVFNLSDSSIVVGVILLGIYLIFFDRARPSDTPAEPVSSRIESPAGSPPAALSATRDNPQADLTDQHPTP